MIRATRQQVLAYRVAAHGLHRDTADVDALGVLDLGVQDTPAGSARLALAARLPAGPDAAAVDGFPVIWSVRGAPHLHRADDLPGLAERLWPVSDADAYARLVLGPQLKKAGIGGLAAFTAATEAMRAAVPAATAKGAASTAMTRRIPAELSRYCESCRTVHVYGDIFQLVGVFAGVRVSSRTSPVTLIPLPRWPAVPARSAGAGPLITAYLRLHGPAQPADVATFLGTSRPVVASQLPDDLVTVEVDGRSTLLPAALADRLRGAPPPRLVRLLPPSDPYLQGRDRALLVPDRSRHKAVWRAVSSPGALLVDGEIAGIWRARMAARSRLRVTIEPFAPMPSSARRAVVAEADRVGQAREVTDVEVVLP